VSFFSVKKKKRSGDDGDYLGKICGGGGLVWEWRERREGWSSAKNHFGSVITAVPVSMTLSDLLRNGVSFWVGRRYTSNSRDKLQGGLVGVMSSKPVGE